MKTQDPSMLIKNPHLKGDPFLWEAGPVGVLLVHGFTATTAEVRPLGQALHLLNYTISGPVLPGHNLYPEEVNKYSWANWVDTVEQTYFELQRRCDRVFVGGESTGGLLSLNLATNHPEISGILSYASALQLTIRPIDQIILRLTAPFIPYIAKSTEEDGLPWKGYSVTPLKGVVQLLRLQKHVLPKLPKIHQPILIIQGKLDN